MIAHKQLQPWPAASLATQMAVEHEKNGRRRNMLLIPSSPVQFARSLQGFTADTYKHQKLLLKRLSAYLQLGQQWHEFMRGHSPEVGSLQGQTTLGQDATLPSNVLSSMDVVSGHHAHSDTCLLAHFYCMRNLLPALPGQMGDVPSVTIIMIGIPTDIQAQPIVVCSKCDLSRQKTSINNQFSRPKLSSCKAIFLIAMLHLQKSYGFVRCM
jgi:hypothetical protein